MRGYPVALAESAPTNAPIHTKGVISPGGQGDGYYHLMDAVIDGKPALVGGCRGDYRFWNLSTGEVLFDFTGVAFYQPPGAVYGAESPAGYTADAQYSFVDPVANVQLGLGSYDAQTKWFDPVSKQLKYYYGGYIKAYPAGVTVPTASNDQTYKHSFVLETVDHKTWNVIFLTRNEYAYVGAGNNSTTKWTGEVSSLCATPGGLYIVLGDGHFQLGVYKYSGGGTPICTGGTTQAAQLTASLVSGTSGWTVHSTILWDGNVYGRDLSSANLRTVAAISSSASAATVAAVPLRGAGAGWTTTAYTPSSTEGYGGIGLLGRQAVVGCNGVLILGQPNALNAAGIAVPFFPVTNAGITAYRAAAWRAPMVSCGGALIMPINANITSNDGDAIPSYLCALLPGGQIRILDVGGAFHQIRVFNDRLYYSASPLYISDAFSYHRNIDCTLKSIPVQDVARMTPPPLAENFNYSTYKSPTNAAPSGISGWFAAYPVSGYAKGELTIYSDQAGTLTITRCSAQKSNGTNNSAAVVYTGLAVTASTQLIVDMAPYLKGGDILALSFSPTTTPTTTVTALSGRMTLQA